MPLWLQDLVAREGRSSAKSCVGCAIMDAAWKCLDCLGNEVFCTACFRKRHQRIPFHRVEHWTGSFFEAAWLCQTGLVLHLGHGGEICPSNILPVSLAESIGDVRKSKQKRWRNLEEDIGSGDEDAPDPAKEEEVDEEECDLEDAVDGESTVASGSGDDEDAQDSDSGDNALEKDVPLMTEAMPDGGDLDWEDYRPKRKRQNRDIEYGNGLPQIHGGVTFVDTSGVHCFKVSYCRCPHAKTRDRQFVDMGFIPASVSNPKTVFTFQLLDDLRTTNLICHTAGTSYWNKLVRKTTNVFPGSVPVSQLYIYLQIAHQRVLARSTASVISKKFFSLLQ